MSMPVEMIIEEPPAGSSRPAADDDRTLAESGFFWRERGGIKILVCAALESAGFTNGFSTRLGGVSPFPLDSLNLAGFDDDSASNISENRRRFLDAIGGGYKLSTRWQVHGVDVRVVDSEASINDTEQKGDALISDLDGVLLGVKTADCVPVLLGDAATGAFSALHAGWRGTVNSIVPEAVAALAQHYRASPSNLVAAIGPAASYKNYEVGAEVIEEFQRNLGDAERYFSATREGHALIDLHAINRDQLRRSGLKDANIYTAPYCTMERLDLFFSHRAESAVNGKTGRLMSVIGRVPSDLPS